MTTMIIYECFLEIVRDPSLILLSSSILVQVKFLDELRWHQVRSAGEDPLKVVEISILQECCFFARETWAKNIKVLHKYRLFADTNMILRRMIKENLAEESWFIQFWGGSVHIFARMSVKLHVCLILLHIFSGLTGHPRVLWGGIFTSLIGLNHVLCFPKEGTYETKYLGGEVRATKRLAAILRICPVSSKLKSPSKLVKVVFCILNINHLKWEF